jgi:predicted ATP-grasp superfamily ATP-dependent carboligase
VPFTVFVTDGNQRSALAVVRALGQRRVSVLVGEECASSLSSRSSYCTRHVCYPSPHRDREAFDRFLLDFVANETIDVVLPVTDVTMRSVSLHQDVIGQHCAVAVPPFAAYERVSNKQTLLQIAGQQGVPVPRTIVVSGRNELKAALDRITYPAVIKPVRSRIPTARGWLHGSVHYVDSELELRRHYDERPYLTFYPSLIQERIVGPGIGLFGLFNRGELVVEFAHKRLREKPPAGGVSVLSESIAVDSRMRDYALRILQPLAWHGVAMVEFKQDSRTGRLFLMEVNGRFWGSLQLAIDAGVNFPLLACELAVGHRPQLGAPYRVGATNRWVVGDLDHLFLRLFRSDRALHLADGAPSKRHVLMDFVAASLRRACNEVYRPHDPAPAFGELRDYVVAAVNSVCRRIARRPHDDDRSGAVALPQPIDATLQR